VAFLRRNRTEPRRRRRVRKLRLLALLAVLFVLAGTAFAYGAVVAVNAQLKGLDPFTQATKQQVDGYVYARDGKTILAVLRGSQSRVLVQSDQISPWMKQAIVAIEDRRFYEHRGVDFRGMARAFWADLTHKSTVQGGSTITQQFVKNQLVGTQKSITRKLKEAVLAHELESGAHHWTKDQILTAYLNTIFYGNNAYGIERAARTYFGHSADKLTLPQAALLAGIPEDPSRYDPVAHPETAKNRRTMVLRQMLQQQIITPGQFRQAARAPMPKPQNVHLSGVVGQAPYFGEYVKSQLIAKLGAKKVFGGGLRVHTTIDLGLQKLARDAIDKWLPSTSGPQAALVAINPSNGAVLAMYGGRNFHASQFNLAVQGERQPGSSFKPFVLATALEQGIAPQTTFVSKPISIFLGDKYWPVNNYEGEYLGTIDLWHAIAASDNSVFAQLTKLVGPKNVVTTAHAMGITGHLDPVFSIGLGTQIVNPLEMARAYATFANGGYRIDGKVFGDMPRAVTHIDTIQNNKVKTVYANAPLKKQVLSTADDELLTQMLEGVVTSGTGTNAALPGYTVGAEADRRAPAGLPVAALSLREHAQRHLPRRPGGAEQRPLQQHAVDRLLHRQGPGPRRRLQDERGRGAQRRRPRHQPRARAAVGAAADAARHLQAGDAGRAGRRRAEAVPEDGDARVVRPRPGRARKGPARRRSPDRRARRAAGADAPRDEEAEGHRRPRRQGEGRPRRRAEAERRRRRSARHDRADHGRSGRLRKREPASPYRHGSSAARVMPMRGPTAIAGSSSRACSSNGGTSSAQPSCSRVIASA
jgi:penicillin-binding protein 1A